MIIEKIVKGLKKRICRAICMSKNVNMSSLTLANRIFNCLSNRYNADEHMKEIVTALYDELSPRIWDSFVKAALARLCERIEELET